MNTDADHLSFHGRHLLNRRDFLSNSAMALGSIALTKTCLAATVYWPLRVPTSIPRGPMHRDVHTFPPGQKTWW